MFPPPPPPARCTSATLNALARCYAALWPGPAQAYHRGIPCGAVHSISLEPSVLLIRRWVWRRANTYWRHGRISISNRSFTRRGLARPAAITKCTAATITKCTAATSATCTAPTPDSPTLTHASARTPTTHCSLPIRKRTTHARAHTHHTTYPHLHPQVLAPLASRLVNFGAPKAHGTKGTLAAAL